MDGFSLMLMGVTSVFLFLGVLVVLLNIMSAIANKIQPVEDTLNTGQAEQASVDDGVIAAVISAAVHRFRNRH